tara:strand:+ start:631 stop:783 length:153 start_codon:yes stop_codon:yes gene_type:complete
MQKSRFRGDDDLMESPEEELAGAIYQLCERLDDYTPELMAVLKALLRRLD